MYSRKHDTVLDPFLGTGTTTTTAAAMAACRNSYWIEPDPNFDHEIRSVIRRSAPEMNGRIHDRMSDHLQFVESFRETKGTEPGYTSTYHNFPVVTRQEQNLRLNYVERIEKVAPGSFSATYRAATDVDAYHPPEIVNFGHEEPTETQLTFMP